jgi:adenine-specific DNA methylase
MSESKVDYNYSSDMNLFDVDKKQEPVVCLGMEFPSEEERRAYFLEELRKKLKDPEFRAIEGFPIAEDEAILELSDPPYYCACPNPWIADLVAEWEREKPAKPEEWLYKREPFAADVSEGKNHPIYNAHSYHTKVPHRAIMRYILHYTEPGDLVFDGFCGTGMTGVAAQLCGDKNEVEALDYKVGADGTIFRKEINEFGRGVDVAFSKLGSRKAVLNDLSPAASFIAYNYNSPVDVQKFKQEAEAILEAVEKECGWMYETRGPNGEKAKINYTVWSDVFVCPECGNEVVFYNEAVNKENSEVNKQFPCSHCNTLLTKRNMKRATVTSYDSALKQTVTTSKQVPVLINYSVGKKRGEKNPDEYDLALIKKIDEMEIPYWYPIDELPDGYNTKQPKVSHNYCHVHQFYTKRNMHVMAFMTNLAKQKSPQCRFLIQYGLLGFSKLARYAPNHYSQVNRYLSGTLYIGSQQVEISPWYIFPNKIVRLVSSEMINFPKTTNLSIITVGDAAKLNAEDASCDYLFLDPPFGANLNYSELSFIWEAWLKVITNNKEEAIENSSQGKGINEYRALMRACFAEAYRVLKPGRWMTVEFSNTDSAVWNSIQTSLSEVGFIVANVSALDKQQGSFKAVTTTKAVKQDLVISLYKPDETFEQQITHAVGEDQVWTFVRKHLSYLPLVKKQGESIITVPERDPRIIYDRVVAYFVGHNMLLPISSGDFLASMSQRFVERDGLYYLSDQVLEYDKLRSKLQLRLSEEAMELFVHDEASAVSWIRYQLKQKPMTLGELTPLFMHELNGWDKNEKRLELSEILSQNFLRYEGNEEVPPAIHSYLSTNFKELRNLSKMDVALQAKAKGRWYIPDPNRERDLERLRERALLKEFEVYRASKGKLKEFRIEAIRAGFKKAWQEKDYQLIKTISERMPSAIVEEDEKLLLWYNGAMTRLGY